MDSGEIVLYELQGDRVHDLLQILEAIIMRIIKVAVNICGVGCVFESIIPKRYPRTIIRCALYQKNAMPAMIAIAFSILS